MPLRAWKLSKRLLETTNGPCQSFSSLNPRVLSGRLPVTRGTRETGKDHLDSLRGTREAGKDSLDSLREAGKNHLDSLGGTREAGKNHLDSLEAPGRPERTREPARHQDVAQDWL